VKLAIVGATGLVGRKMLEVLKERKFNISELLLVASEKSIGDIIKYDGQEISIINNSGNVLCFVKYYKSWYKDLFKANGGWSIKMIDTNNPCGCYDNWSASNSNSGGTPGLLNSVSAFNPDFKKPFALRISIINESNINLIFSEPMNYLSINKLFLYSLDDITMNLIKLKPISPDYSNIEISLSHNMLAGTFYSLNIKHDAEDCIGNKIDYNNNLLFALPQEPEFNDIIINEILFDPLPNGSEFVEFYNRSGKCIDLSDLYICNDTPGESNPVQLHKESFLLFEGEYIVITENKHDIINRYNCPYPQRIININSLPGLPDSEGNIFLIDRKEIIIDEINYSKNLHHPLIHNADGVSIERISTEVSSFNNSNWHSAAASDSYASPGFANTQSYSNYILNDHIELKPDIFSPDNDGYNDILKINYNFEENGLSGTIKIFDSNGRLVRELLNNGLFGTSGSFFWNGTKSSGEISSTGIYIIYIEVFDLKGNVHKYKKCCVLAK